MKLNWGSVNSVYHRQHAEIRFIPETHSCSTGGPWRVWRHASAMSVFKQVLDLQRETSFTAIYITNRKEDKNRSMCLLCHNWSEISAESQLTVDSGIKINFSLKPVVSHQYENYWSSDWLYEWREVSWCVLDQWEITSACSPHGELELLMHRQDEAEARVRCFSELQKTFYLVLTENCLIHFEILGVFCV